MAVLGRDAELAALRRILEDVGTGRGAVAMLTGDTGIGKTRMAEELSERAERSGFAVTWGRSPEDEGAPPFWPWVQALREQLGKHDVMDLPTLVGHAPASPGERPESARFRLFDATCAAVKGAARSRPIVFVLEDLHAADPPTLQLLTFLARELARHPVFLLGSYRDVEVGAHHPLSRALGELSRSKLRTFELRGLRPAAVRRILRDAIGKAPGPDLVRSIHKLTEGNPFFVTELADWLSRDGEKRSEVGIPRSVTGAVAHRLRRMSALSRDVLVTAAVIGREFDFEVLRDLRRDVDESRLLAAIEEARASHTIVETESRSAAPPGRERYRFRHTLLRDALYRESSPSHRARLHARVAEALEARGTDAPVSQLAYHFAAARSVVEPAKRLDYSRRAGFEALATHAYDEARRHFESAWELVRNSSVDAGSAEILFGLGVSEAATSARWNRQSAWDRLRLAADFFLAHGDVARAVAIVTDPALTPEGTSGMAPVLERMLERVSRDSLEEARLLARLAAASYFETGDYAMARERFQRSLAIAKRHGDEALELRALALKTSVDHFEVRWHDVLAGSQRVIELARKCDDPYAESYARYRAAYALMYSGRVDEAKTEADENLSRAERLQDRGLLEDALYVKATLAQLEGRWSDAREQSDRGLEIASSGAALVHNRVLMEYELGDTDQGARYLDELADASARAGPYPLREAFVPLATLQTARVATLASKRERASPQASSETRVEAAVVPAARALVGIARALESIERGDVDAIEDHIMRLNAYRGLMVAPCLVTDRLLGRLSLATGRKRDAVRHLERAVNFYRDASYRPELAWSCFELAAALVELSPSPCDEAAALVEEAEALASSLGMKPLARLVAHYRTRHRAKLVRKPAGLTRRELEVLALVVSGRTNKDIASELCISTNTVAVHVARILEKTGSTNRTEAARFAVEHDLIDRDRK